MRLVSYTPPILNSEKLLPKWLSAFRFGGYLHFIKPTHLRQGRKNSSLVRQLGFLLIGVLAFQPKRLSGLCFGRCYHRMVIRGYTFRRSPKPSTTTEGTAPGAPGKNAPLCNNTHSVTNFVTLLKNLALLKLYWPMAKAAVVVC